MPLGDTARKLLDALPGERRADAFLFPLYTRRQAPGPSPRVLAHDLRRCRSRQPVDPRPASYSGKPRGVLSGENLPCDRRALRRQEGRG